MTEQEQKDLNKLKANIADIKVKAIDYQLHMLSWKELDFKHSGHKDLQSALKYTIEDAHKCIMKLTNEYIKRYPDD